MVGFCSNGGILLFWATLWPGLDFTAPELSAGWMQRFSR